MTFTYNVGDLGTDPRTEVRLLLQDTVASQPLLQDEEIDHLLSENANDVPQTVAEAAEIIGRKFARKADAEIGGAGSERIRIDLGERARFYHEMAAGFRRSLVLRARFEMTGQTKAEKEALASDSEAIQPKFERSMMEPHDPDPEEENT